MAELITTALLVALPVSGVLWLAWRVRNDRRGAWTNKSPERFSQDYKVVSENRRAK